MTIAMHRLFLILLLSLSTAIAQDSDVTPGSDLWKELYNPPYAKPTEIPRDNPLRKQLFDLLRPQIERAAKLQGIKFQGELKASGGPHDEALADWVKQKNLPVTWRIYRFPYFLGNECRDGRPE